MQRTKAFVWYGLGLLVAFIGIWMLWSYIFSFQEVVFAFDTSKGQVEIVGTDNQKLYPVSGQSVRLKKGEYRARNIGQHVAPDQRNLTIDASHQRIEVSFNYTRTYLDGLLPAQQSAIETALYEKYPRAQTLYTLTHGKLYHLGEVYGATLEARDMSGDNSDTLRVLLRKQDNDWKLLTRPPTPILSAPLYRDIDRSILVDINQAK